MAVTCSNPECSKISECAICGRDSGAGVGKDQALPVVCHCGECHLSYCKPHFFEHLKDQHGVEAFWGE